MSFKLHEKRILERLQDLKPCYTYHSLEHTEFVVIAVELLAKEEGVTLRELELLKLAALFHDSGFLDSPNNHEEHGCKMVRRALEESDYSPEEIGQICGMIMATKIPQSPRTRLEEILADADLFYLGTDKYDRYSRHLFDELKYFNPKMSDNDWINLQVGFLEAHHFHTAFGKNNLLPKKQENLLRIKASVPRKS